MRYLALEHAALVPLNGIGRPFAGDHQHKRIAARLGGAQEADQLIVGFPLGQAMQVKATADHMGSAGDALAHASAKRRKRRLIRLACGG
jgi:hypothetical protein